MEKIKVTPRDKVLTFGMKVLITQSCLTLCNPMDCSLPSAPLSMGFSRQKYWSGLPRPPPGDLPDPGIEPGSLCLLHWQAGSLPLVPHGKPTHCARTLKGHCDRKRNRMDCAAHEGVSTHKTLFILCSVW